MKKKIDKDDLKNKSKMKMTSKKLKTKATSKKQNNDNLKKIQK